MSVGIGTALGLGAAASAAIPGVIGAGAGLAKDIAAGQQESRSRKAAVEQMKWSPWTGMTPEKVQGAPFGSGIAQGLGAGLAVGQQNQQQDADNDFRTKLLNIIGGNQASAAQAGGIGSLDLASLLKKDMKYL